MDIHLFYLKVQMYLDFNVEKTLYKEKAVLKFTVILMGVNLGGR